MTTRSPRLHFPDPRYLNQSWPLSFRKTTPLKNQVRSSKSVPAEIDLGLGTLQPGKKRLGVVAVYRCAQDGAKRVVLVLRIQ